MTLQQGLVGHWTFDSLDVKDNSAYDNDGTVNGNPTTTTGQVGGAVKLDGSSDYINIGSPSGLDISGDVTVAGWVQFANANTDNYSTFFTRGGYVTDGFVVQRISSSAVADQPVRIAFDGSTTLDGDISLQDTDWHHIVLVQRGSDVELYIDGVEDPNSPFTNRDFTKSSSLDWEFGRRTDSNDQYVNGKFDDFRVYNRALSQSEIQQLKNVRNKRASANKLYKGLVGHWTLNSLDAKDSSAYDNDGTVKGSPSVVNANWGTGVEFAGTSGADEGVTVPNQSQLNFDDERVSLAVWCRPDDKTSDFQGIAVKTNNFAESEVNYGFEIQNSKLTFLLGNDVTGNGAIELASSITITEGQWYHVVGTYDPSTDEVKVYVDDVLDASASFTNAMGVNTGSFNIGYFTGTKGYFKGAVSDVRVYNRVLSQAEVEQLASQRAKQVQR